MDALTTKYRGGWPRLVHLSAHYARDSGTTTMWSCKIYREIVLSILLYGTEAWTVYRRQVKKLHAFMTRHLRSIMKITEWTKWQARKYSNGQGCHLWKIFWSERISGGLDTSWGCHQTGYKSRFSTLNCLLHGHRKRGRPCLRFKDTIKRNMKLRDIKTDSWTSLSQQRDKCRALVKWWKQSVA